MIKHKVFIQNLMKSQNHDNTCSGVETWPHITSFDWLNIFDTRNCKVKYKKFSNMIDKFFPIKWANVRKCDKPWMMSWDFQFPGIWRMSSFAGIHMKNHKNLILKSDFTYFKIMTQHQNCLLQEQWKITAIRLKLTSFSYTKEKNSTL